MLAKLEVMVRSHVQPDDPFADLSVEATLIDPKCGLPKELRQLADQLAESESQSTLPPGAVTRVKARINQVGSGATQIGELLPKDMDVLMTAHLPVSFDLDDIAGDELGDAREYSNEKAQKSMHAIDQDGEISDPLVRPVDDLSLMGRRPMGGLARESGRLRSQSTASLDEPHTVNAYLEQALPDSVKKPAPKGTQSMRPSRKDTPKPAKKKPSRPNLEARAFDPLFDSLEGAYDSTLPPVKPRPSQVARAVAAPSGPAPGFSIPDAVTKTNFGPAPRAEATSLEPSFDDDDDLPLPVSEPSPSRSFDQVLDRVRSPRPRHDVAPQRYIPTVITSQPKIGTTAEDTSIVAIGDRDEDEPSSGFADGKKAMLGTAEAEALTKPPRTVSPYIILGLGVIGAIAALAHAIQAPL